MGFFISDWSGWILDLCIRSKRMQHSFIFMPTVERNLEQEISQISTKEKCWGRKLIYFISGGRSAGHLRKKRIEGFLNIDEPTYKPSLQQ